MLKIKQKENHENVISNPELLKLMQQNLDGDIDNPEFEIIDILMGNINETQFQVSTNAAELLCECYPEIFE